MEKIKEFWSWIFYTLILEIQEGNKFFEKKEKEAKFMKKFLGFTTLLQILKWIVITIFFIAEKPSLLFYLEAGIVEYLINIVFVKFYYKNILYCCIISIPIVKTIIPSLVLGKRLKFKNPFKLKKPHTT